MHLALVPRELAPDPNVVESWRPQLPPAFHANVAPRAWWQASSEFKPDGKVLVCLGAVEPSWVEDLKRQAGARYVKRLRSDAETGELMRALDTGDSKAARDAVLAAYRPAAASEERDRAVRAAVRTAAWWGLAAAGTWLSWRLGVPYAAALTLLAADTFNRADGVLNGSSMSDGVNSWASTPTGFSVSSNTVVIGATNRGIAASSVTPEARMRTTMVWTSGNMGPSARSANPGADNYNYRGSTTLYEKSGGSYTSLGTVALGSAGDVVAVDCDGTSISAIRNSSTVIGPVTDSTHTSGYPGIDAGTTGVGDTWQAEGADAAPAATVSLLTLLGVG